MNKVAIAGILILILCGTVVATEPKLIDFGSFQTEVIEYNEIDQFTGEKGDVIKPSRRDARFVEVTLRFKANKTGEFCLYPTMFSALFCYRGLAQAVPAVAMGTKIVDKITSDTREYWYNEPEVSIILGVKKNETITKYFILEIPKEVDDFIFQGPMAIQTLILGD